MRLWNKVLRATLIVLAALLVNTPHAAAQTAAQNAPTDDESATSGNIAPVNSVTQQDLDGDGQPDLTVISTELVGAGDQILVYDGGDNMQTSTDWREATDFRDDTWLFDVGSDRLPQLVIYFEPTDTGIQATFYPDQNGNRVVDVITRGSDVQMVEWETPPLVMSVEGDWVLPNGKWNWNVTFETDGALLFRYPRPLPIELLDTITEIWTPFLSLNGNTDTVFEFHDDDLDGIPEYHLWRLLVSSPRSTNAARARLWANHSLKEPAQPFDYDFWGYLVSSSFDFVTQDTRYFDLPPIINVNWAEGTITPPMLFGYPIEDGYHVHNFRYWEKQAINYADFEIEQAYYDLADDQDGDPELHIRHRFNAFDLENVTGPGENEIRWSWNQSNADGLFWDFKIGLAGRHPVDGVIEFPEVSYRAIPYEEMPGWVLERDWDWATLIATEDGGYYPSTEGIYEWPPIETLVDSDQGTLPRYIRGQEVVDLYRAFRDTRVGQRAEFTLHLGDKPYLYYSPIDHKWHLQNAVYSTWRPDNRDRQIIENLNGDEHLDSWSYYHYSDEQNRELKRQLVQAGDYLIYSDEGEVSVRRVNQPPTTDTRLPPATHDEWQAWQEIFTPPTDQPFATGDYRAMLNQFDGREWTVKNATMRDFRFVEDGFRFVMTVHPRPIGRTDLPARIPFNLTPGEYVAEVINDDLNFRELTPPNFVVESLEFSTDAITELQGARVTLTVANTGLEDSPDTLIRLYAQNDNDLRLLDEAIVDLMGEESVTIPLIWTPENSKIWTLMVTASPNATEADLNTVVLEPGQRPPNAELLGEIFDSEVAVVDVLPITQPSASQFLTLDNEQPLRGLPIIMLLISIAVSAGTLFLLIVRELEKER